MSPFLTALFAGALGGMATGLVIGLTVVLFGRRIAEGLLEQQVTHLEARFKENVLDVLLGRVATFLDQGERIGQIVKRVVEIGQLLLRRGPAEDPAATALATSNGKPIPVPASSA